MKPTYSTTHMLMYLRKKLRRILDVQSDAAGCTVGEVLDLFGRSEKFMLPQDGLLFDDTNPSHFVRFFRLPFPSIVLEYDATTGKYGAPPKNNEEAVKVVLLATEATAEGGVIPAETVGATVVIAYSQQSHPGQWFLMPSAVFIPYGSQAQEFAADIKKIAVAELYPWRDILRYDLRSEDENEFKLCTYAVIQEALALFHFCSALNCSNVTYDTIKAPKFINSKRKAKGELPLYEYKILTVDTRARHADTGDVLSTGRKHASPRQHIRRGHIRHYKSGKNVWIQQMTVGDPGKGRIDKDYKLKASTGFTPGASPKS